MCTTAVAVVVADFPPPADQTRLATLIVGLIYYSKIRYFTTASSGGSTNDVIKRWHYSYKLRLMRSTRVAIVTSLPKPCAAIVPSNSTYTLCR